MNIQDIEKRLIDAKDNALTALGIPEDMRQQINLAPPPDPTMGDRGFPVFVLAKHLRKGPPVIANEIAAKIQEQLAEDDIITEVNTAGPYVNLRLHPGKLAAVVAGQALREEATFGAGLVAAPQHWMVEYSAPNTNKPQHLGHVRNNLLGAAVSKILDFAGNRVTRVNLINDRGIHICKSMLAYELFGEGETPESSGIKGDHLVGKYYVLFEQKFRAEYEAWLQTLAADAKFKAWLDTPAAKDAKKQAADEAALRKAFAAQYKDTYFNTESDLGLAAKEMLRKWEAGDEETLALWNTMNSWVFAGFDETYARLGVAFDHVYRESETYQSGKDTVLEGLKAGKFSQLDDGAIVCDLERLGLQGQKVLLRGDGTSVYMTQDLGTAQARFDEYDIDQMVYVVGNEQEYHFDVLFRILAMLDPSMEGRLHHLSYGMVVLPEGKMKSREGKVVDADDLMDEMQSLATDAIQERYADLDPAEVRERARVIGLAALKYFILDFTPRSTVQFDPQKSIDFQGRTGPYCLYSYARIQSIGRKLGGWPELEPDQTADALQALGTDLELAVIRQLQDWPRIATFAAANLDPSKITEHLFNICKAFSTMYNDPDHRIIDMPEGTRRSGILLLTKAVAQALKAGLDTLGIETLEEM